MPEISEMKNTRNYSDFSILSNNRATNESHIQKLKKVYEKKGYLTEVDPILVNERMQVIDGQHRLAASEELGIPVYYRVAKGMTVADAREMNINRRNWNNQDYAKSYADGGHKSYQNYLKLREEYPLINHSTMIHYIDGDLASRKHAAFRDGELVLNEHALPKVRERLDKLQQIMVLVGEAGRDTAFTNAFLRCLISPDYDHNRMLSKLQKQGIVMMRFRNVVDAQRQLEDVYNHGTYEANRVRLF